jgi:hypothetical protein
MEIFGLIFLLVALVLIGVGLALGLVACAVAVVLVLAGVVSVSAAVGVWCRRPGPAFRALVYQLLTLAGAVSGIVAAWVISTLFALNLPAAALVVCGLLGGAAGGLSLAALIVWTIEKLTALAASIWEKRQKALESHHPARPELDAG